MTEVFKTNILHPEEAKSITSTLTARFPEYKINVDINDCDKVLRVVNTRGVIETHALITVVERFGYRIEMLPD